MAAETKKNSSVNRRALSVFDTEATAEPKLEISDIADLVSILTEKVGGRKAASRAMGVAPTTLDNYRSGQTQPKILEVWRLSTAAQVPMASLFSPGAQGLIPPTFTHSVSVPYYDFAASAGAGRLVVSQNVREYFAVGHDWLRRNLPAWAPSNALIGVLEGSGDSMEPTIMDGDLIMVVQQPDWWVVERGGIFVFTLDNDRLLLKRLQVKLNGDLAIISDNPAYATETIPKAELQDRLIIHAQVFFTGGKPRSFAPPRRG